MRFPFIVLAAHSTHSMFYPKCKGCVKITHSSENLLLGLSHTGFEAVDGVHHQCRRRIVMRTVHQLYLFLVIISSTQAFNLTVPSPNTTTDLVDNRFGSCFPWAKKASLAPKLTDCQLAISQLPQFDGHDSFHNEGPNEPYNIPIQRKARTCTIIVRMIHQGSTKDGDSWPELARKATYLANRCLGFYVPSFECAGGIISSGKHDRINIVVQSSRTPENEVQ